MLSTQEKTENDRDAYLLLKHIPLEVLKGFFTKLGPGYTSCNLFG